MRGLRRALALAVAALAVFASIKVAVPAGAVTGVVTQSAPQFVSPDEPLPGTSKNVTLVGHIAPPMKGTTKPAGQYAALAMAGNCAYIARRSFDHSTKDTHFQADNGLGVQIVNVSNPAAPAYVGDIPETAVLDTTAREIRAIPQYGLLLVLQYSMFTGGGVDVGVAGQPVTSTGGSNLMQAFRINSADCSTKFLGQYDMGPLKPHEFYTWIDPKRPGRVIAYVTTPFGPGEMSVFDFSSCSAVAGQTAPASCAPTLLTIWDGGYPQPSTAAVSNSGIGNYLHSLSISPDGRTGYMAFWNGGFFTVDTSQVADDQPNPLIIGEASTSPRDDWSAKTTGQGGDAHSAVWIPTDLSRTAVKPYVVLTDEDYLGVGDCPFGWVHIDRLQPVAGGLNLPVPVSTYGLKENLLPAEAAAVEQSSRASAALADPNSCAGYERDHPGFIGASSAWPGGQIPANAYTSHNPTTLPDLILLTWYGGGFQVVNIHDPARPQEAGFFVPTPEPVVNEEVDDPSGNFLGCYYPVGTAADTTLCQDRTGPVGDITSGSPNTCQPPNCSDYDVKPQVVGWSYPIIQNGLIYFVDNRNGLYIVKYSGPFAKEVGRTPFAEGNSNNTAALMATGTKAPKSALAGAGSAAAAAAPASSAPQAAPLRARPAAARGSVPLVPIGGLAVLAALAMGAWRLRAWKGARP
ncbi:MAG TPA: HIG1 domain-containing protein [Candidatus Dormibacteraeota bacterium]